MNSIRDPYNRRIDYLRISVTDKCNLNCLYCTPERGLKHFKESDLLTSEEIVRFVRIAYRYGLRKVRITGGEPLMRKNIIPLISSIKDIGIRDLSLTTNGIMLSHLAGDLKKAGLDRVNISLDTLDSERYKTITKGGNIQRVLESIEKAERVGLSPVKINVIPIRGFNDDELVSFASLTKNNNLHIRFIEFMPVHCNTFWKKDRCITGAEVIEKISALGSLTRIRFRGKGPSRNYRINGFTGIIGIISPLTDHFCKFCNRLRLSADGKIVPCLFSRISIDMKSPLRNNAPDEEIERLFLSSIKSKPQRHLFSEQKTSAIPSLSMSQIGG
jgi:cyclic pyranopterin phosphate synthase